MLGTLLASIALAQSPPPRAGWARQGSSLLLYGPSGSLEQEIGLGRWEDSGGPRLEVRETRGGAAPSGRFAWTFERKTVSDPSRDKVFESKRLLRFLGSDGHELWSAGDADFPKGSDPLVFSQDGETVVLARRGKDGWTAAVKSYTGNTWLEAGPFAMIEGIAVSPNGRYALARWSVPDQSATHTFLDVPSKNRKDLPSSDFYRGPARLTDEGQVYSGPKLVFVFEAPVSTGTVKP